MYRFGRPTKQRNYLAGLLIVLIVGAIVAAVYADFIRKSAGENGIHNSQPVTQTITGGQTASISINEPLFSLELPGQWRETARDPDPRYQSIQWNYVGKNSAGRWVRIYTDTIPSDFAVNYLLPVKSLGARLSVGQISDNCVTFTQSATSSTNRDISTPSSAASASARWQGVNFLCDVSHVSHQVVGIGSTDGANTVTLTGPQHGKHQFFLAYEDDNYHPDYSIFMSILSSLTAK